MPDLVRRATFRSNVLPPITVTFSGPATPGESSGVGGALLRAVAPELELETALGSADGAPYGRPIPGLGTVVTVAVGIVVAVVVYRAVRSR